MVIILNTLQLPPELSKDEIEKIPVPEPSPEEILQELQQLKERLQEMRRITQQEERDQVQLVQGQSIERERFQTYFLSTFGAIRIVDLLTSPNIDYTLQLPAELSRDEIEQPRTESEEQQQLEQAIRVSLEAGKIMTILSFLSFSLLKVKLTRQKLMLRQRKDS